MAKSYIAMFVRHHGNGGHCKIGHVKGFVSYALDALFIFFTASHQLAWT